jgi:hypothetical protein
MTKLVPTLMLVTLAASAQTDAKVSAQAWRDNPAFKPFSATVKLTLSGDTLESEISSYLLRELRSLQGIGLVDTLQDFEINVVAINVPKDRPQMITFSYLFTSVLFAEKMIGLQSALAPDMLATFNGVYRETHRIERFGVKAFGVTVDLKQQCARLIAQFDTEIIEPRRRVHETMREKIKELVVKLEAAKP